MRLLLTILRNHSLPGPAPQLMRVHDFCTLDSWNVRDLLQFLDDAEMEFFCPECGIKIRLDGDSLPNFCLKCGNKLPVE